jgi:hypothetical protein
MNGSGDKDIDGHFDFPVTSAECDTGRPRSNRFRGVPLEATAIPSAAGRQVRLFNSASAVDRNK